MAANNVYPVYDIDGKQAQKILMLQEDYLNDIKAKEIKPAKLSETVSAFANAAGGDIYIGISENKNAGTRVWDGFADPEAANDMIHTLFKAHPFGNHIKPQFLRASDMRGLVLHISVNKVKEIVRSSSGDIFVRVNAGKQKIDTEDERNNLSSTKE